MRLHRQGRPHRRCRPRARCSGVTEYPRSAVTELVIATPVFLDLTFVGLESLPALGEARAYAGRPPDALSGVRALFVNRGEAVALTGAATVEEAAATLAGLAQTVVVTLASDGAIACSRGEIVAATAERIERPVDTTG